jgi:hypothetical protein
VLGRGKHPFPFAQKVYMRRKRLLQETKAEPRMPSKIHESEPVEVHSNPIQHKEPTPDVIPLIPVLLKMMLIDIESG